MTSVASTPQMKVGFLTSFRSKFIALIASTVLLSLLLGGGIALYNVRKLARDASAEIESGLTKASEEYITRYIDMTAQRADLMFQRTFDQIKTLAQFSQAFLDNPKLGSHLSEFLAHEPEFQDNLQFNPKARWIQNVPGETSAVSIWGYLLNPDGTTKPGVSEAVRDSAYFDLLMPALMNTGPAKLWVYYVGPKAHPFIRAAPWSDQASNFDKLYPGHNETNWWDFFFPGIYEPWQKWGKNPGLRPVPSDITVLAPYVDASTGNLIVSFLQPLFTKDREDVAGVVGIDIMPKQLTELVQGVKIAETGFAFLAEENGNVITISEQGQDVLGLTAQHATGPGVTSQDLSLSKSKFKDIANLEMPQPGATTLTQVQAAGSDGKTESLLVALHPLQAMNMWKADGGITAKHLMLGFVVPDREIYASLYAAQNQINSATTSIIKGILGSMLGFLLLVLLLAIGLSRRFTSGLVSLADAANRLTQADYDLQIPVKGKDEVAMVSAAFNSMAREIREHTETLELRVADRTRELASANDEIQQLYEKLQDENLRMGAELDIARRLQMMVMPAASELDGIPDLDIASYVEPADEVGGDYFDVLYMAGRAKIGIGDVTGHGIESGVLMLMVQSVALALYERGADDPRTFLDVLNRAIYKNAERTKSGKHLSLSFLDYADNEVTLSGQHEETIIIRKDGSVERIDTMDLGFPIGLEENISEFLSATNRPFLPGDMIVLFTDGITEAESEDNQLYGIERLIDISVKVHRSTASEAVAAIIADVRAHIGTQKVHDDITLVVLKHR